MTGRDRRNFGFAEILVIAGAALMPAPTRATRRASP
jgi:hypothetical protein